MLISSLAAIKWALPSMITPTDREGTMLLDLVPDGLRHHQPAAKSSVARKSSGAKSSPCIFEVEVYFNFNVAASQEGARAVSPLLARVAACGSFRHCHGGHGPRNHCLQQQPGGSPVVSAARGRCRPGPDQICAPVGRIHWADRVHLRG